MDFTVQNEFTIYLLHADIEAAREWVHKHIAADAQRSGNAVIVHS